MKKPTAGASVAKDDGEGEGEKFEIGKIYSVKLSIGDELNGIVLAYDSNPKFVIFEEGTNLVNGLGPRIFNRQVKRVLGLERKRLELSDTGDN